VRAASCVCIQHSAVTQTACSLWRTAQAVSRRWLFYKYRYTSLDTRKCNFIYALKNLCSSLSRCGDILKFPTALLSGLLYRIWIKTKEKRGESNRSSFTHFSNCCCYGRADLHGSDVQSVHFCGQQPKGSQVSRIQSIENAGNAITSCVPLNEIFLSPYLLSRNFRTAETITCSSSATTAF